MKALQYGCFAAFSARRGNGITLGSIYFAVYDDGGAVTARVKVCPVDDATSNSESVACSLPLPGTLSEHRTFATAPDVVCEVQGERRELEVYLRTPDVPEARLHLQLHRDGDDPLTVVTEGIWKIHYFHPDGAREDPNVAP